jgi:alkylated DNA nucleotide flippase Atl1
MPAYSRHVGQGKHLPIPSSPIPLPNLPLTVHDPPMLYCNLSWPRYCTALKFLSPDADPPVPWQRVVSSAGKISSRGPGTDGAQRQREALEAEDVEVRAGRTNELLIDLAEYGWFPAPGTIGL